MLSLLRQLFRDPNGNGHAAIKAFQLQRERSVEVSSSMAEVTADLRKAREAVLLKAHVLKMEAAKDEEPVREASQVD